VILCIVVVGYQRFTDPCCHPPSSGWRWRQHGPPKCWHPATTLHGVIIQRVSTWIFTAANTLNLA